MKQKNKSPRTAAKKIAEIRLQKLDLTIDAMLSKSGIERVKDKPALDKFINKKFVRDIAAVILDAPDEIESGE